MFWLLLSCSLSTLARQPVTDNLAATTGQEQPTEGQPARWLWSVSTGNSLVSEIEKVGSGELQPGTTGTLPQLRKFLEYQKNSGSNGSTSLSAGLKEADIADNLVGDQLAADQGSLTMNVTSRLEFETSVKYKIYYVICIATGTFVTVTGVAIILTSCYIVWVGINQTDMETEIPKGHRGPG